MTNPQPTHRSLTGIVTKLVGDGATYGFINDEIFFPQTNVVSDGPASVGDQVFAECEYSAHLPIKWNATSVKILSKAAVGQANNASDRSQQELVNQQQQFNQAPSVAVTYQQHRQQRQQRQMLDTNKQQDDNKPRLPQQNEPPPASLLDQNAGDFYGAGIGSRGFPQQPQLQMAQQQDGNIPPFQDQPMGPPNFTFTSQPGSAFVQPQFLPPAFLPQQPPPLLPQSQHLLPNNQATNNNQRSNVHNKNGPGGNRYNNMDKNDRQQNRRNQNRNENKFDRPRSGDRDGPIDRSRGNNSRDRSVGRGGKRDGPSRPSPPHSSARSPTSSDRGIKSSRRHYEPQNIPKTRIMANMNAYNMKQRCPTSVHVPSDLKDIIVNKHFRLDIKSTPKPLKFVIESSKENKPDTTHSEANESNLEPDMSVDKPQETDTPQNQDKQIEAKSGDEEGPTEQGEVSEKPEIKTMERPASKSDLRLNHKYGVKVILISIPEFDAIYRKVFGDDLDSYSSESKSRSRLDESITLLCNKSSNNGHSLIGGKFDPTLDGFIEGKNNRFERHGRQPDLIATCKRVVLEQTGLDLGSCRGWNLLSTFIYNNKSDYFSPKASVEYSFIYMPQIWTMLKESSENSTSISIDSVPAIKEQISSEQAEEPSTISDAQMLESQDTPAEQTELDIKEVKDQPDEEGVPNDPETQEPESMTAAEALDSVPSIHDMKRDDLKAELDKRGIKYKTNAKKSELLELLEGSLNGGESVSEDTSKVECDEPPQNPQLEEGEVIENDPSEDSSNGVSESDATKRKAEDVGESESKRICVEPEEVEIKPASMSKRVELISEAFVVKSREEQQLSLVTLHEASQVSRHDQFELSVVSNLLKESLIQHLSEYILTTLVEENRQQSSGNSTSSQQNSQESTSLGSDTNNNNAAKSLPKGSNQSDSKLNSKEYPVDRYINLAFSYFDSTHMGYVYSDDLNKLFNNTNLTISKRALSSLLGDSEKFNYRTLPDLSPKLPATYIYEFPEQFRSLSDDKSSELASSSAKMIEFKGVVYDVEKLIQEVKDAETLRVSMVDRFNYAIENSDKQIEEIHVLEVSQKSLSKAIKAQNDEICDLKRDRDSIKKKYENVRKGIKNSISNLSELIKEEK